MTTPNVEVERGFCWDTPAQPTSELLNALKDGPFKSLTGAKLSDLLASLRRETVTRPVIYVGAGTCGLGAGADKTLEQIRAYCAAQKLDVEVNEVGCVGLCS